MVAVERRSAFSSSGSISMYLSLAYSKPLTNVPLFDFARLVDIPMMHTLVRLSIDLVKLDLPTGIGSGKDLYPDRNE